MKKALVTGLVAAGACLLGCKLFIGEFHLLTGLFTGGAVYGYCHCFCSGSCKK